MHLSRSVYAYQPKPHDDGLIIEALTSLADQHPRWGFGKMFPVIKRQEHGWNHKKVYRVYCELKMNLRRKGKKRLPNRNPRPLCVPDHANISWSADFMSDALYGGRRFRTFNVVDDFNREALEIEVDLNLPAPRIIRVLDRIAAWRGYPQRLRLDNGPEMISVAMADWAKEHCVQLDFIQPGKPTQNSFIERFNRTYREEVLDLYIFNNLSEVQDITQDWLRQYNEERPHESLGNLTPAEYLALHDREVSTFQWH